MLPISLLFLIINFIVILTSLYFYFSIFFYKLIKIKIFNKKVNNITYKRRFKFLKNFYIILLEKILITYPKQKAFLFFYLLTKSIYEKDKSILKKEYLPEILKSLSNRILILIILSIPYILIFCNTNLILIIKELSEYNYESKKAFFNSILVNILKDLTNDYNKLLLKLKIKFYKNKIIFNSKKDLINALKYKKEFYGNFYKNKKSFKVLMVKHKISSNKLSKEHFTAISKFKENIIYLNETSNKNLSYYKYHKEISKYIEEQHKNSYIHKGSINEKKITYFTPNIITEKNNILIIDNYKNNVFIKNMKEEKLNNILASFSLNLDQKYLETKIAKINGVNQNILIENINLKKTIELYKENKENIEKEQFESILGMQFF